MSSLLRGGLLLAAIMICTSSAAQAELFRCLFGNCGRCTSCSYNTYHHPHPCNTCQQPPTLCQCTTMRPVVETRYQPQQTVCYKDVYETRYRKEQSLTKVPVTKYENVTVDAGSYQMVWVPRPVTQQVARTVYQDCVAERIVPYTVSRRVPQVTTQMVPTQHVRYVPQQTQMIVKPGCSTCDSHTAISTGAPAGQLVNYGPTPDPQFSGGIAHRHSYDGANGYGHSHQVHHVATSSSARGKFQPAPNAAAAWQARQALAHP